MSNQTVEQILSAADDSVSVINGVNDGSWNTLNATQEEINEMVQRNVDHLEIVLAYDGENNHPDVAGSSDNKSSYTSAITTGKAYISANS